MNLFTLVLGITLPWLAGFAWVRALERHAASEVGFLRQASYGFFAGMVLLYLCVAVVSWISGRVTFVSVAGALLLLAAPAAWMSLRGSTGAMLAARPWRQTWAGLNGWQRLSLLVLLAWSLAHLLFSTLEVIVTPLFPWDAWTVWVYRAKAWFFTGHLFEFAGPSQWLWPAFAGSYTVPAAGYPWLVSIVPYWAAVSLDQWHEALINLPVVFCGIAIATALYSQCRAIGLSLPMSVGFAYLLVSTPLVGTHLSLAGYADIWMAGFAGLGFVALLRGVSERRRSQVVTGFAMLALGLLVKNEAVVWLFVGLLFYLVLSVPWKIQVYCIAGAGLVVLLLSLLGMTVVELPLLGRLGIENGHLLVPGAGVYRLELHDVREAYFQNAFVLGSWHLAWMLLLAGLVLALLPGAGRTGRVAAVFLLIFVSSQAGIFVLSSEAAWAKDYTAINRLPLHVYPALLFALAMVTGSLLERAEGPVPARRVLLATAAGLVILAAGTFLWLQRQQSEVMIQPAIYGPSDLASVIGSVTEQGGKTVADGYRDGLVLLSSGPVSIDAGRHTLLRLDLASDPGLEWPGEAPAFFWRRADAGAEVARITLDGSALVDLSVAEDWSGEVIEFGLLFVEHEGEPAVFGGLQLQGQSPGSAIELAPREWFEFEIWTQKSGNFLYGGAPDQHIPLTLLVVIWVVLTVLLAGLAWRSPGSARMLVTIGLIGWLLLDVRWTADRYRQMGISIDALANQSVDERISGSELGKFYPYIRKVRDELIGHQPARVLLILDPAEHKYFGLRSKYQLLPHQVGLDHYIRRRSELKSFDYVLFLGEFRPSGEDGAAAMDLEQRYRQLPIKKWVLKYMNLVDSNVDGLLFAPRKAGGS